VPAATMAPLIVSLLEQEGRSHSNRRGDTPT